MIITVKNLFVTFDTFQHLIFETFSHLLSVLFYFLPSALCSLVTLSFCRAGVQIHKQGPLYHQDSTLQIRMLLSYSTKIIFERLNCARRP
jgi:hypothetical protein